MKWLTQVGRCFQIQCSWLDVIPCIYTQVYIQLGKKIDIHASNVIKLELIQLITAESIFTFRLSEANTCYPHITTQQTLHNTYLLYSGTTLKNWRHQLLLNSQKQQKQQACKKSDTLTELCAQGSTNEAKSTRKKKIKINKRWMASNEIKKHLHL